MNAEDQRVHDKAMDLVCKQGAEIEKLRSYAGKLAERARRLVEKMNQYPNGDSYLFMQEISGVERALAASPQMNLTNERNNDEDRNERDGQLETTKAHQGATSEPNAGAHEGHVPANVESLHVSAESQLQDARVRGSDGEVRREQGSLGRQGVGSESPPVFSSPGVQQHVYKAHERDANRCAFCDYPPNAECHREQSPAGDTHG